MIAVRTLAKLHFVADHIEDIILNLKGKSDRAAVTFQRFELLFAGTAARAPAFREKTSKSLVL